VLYFLYSKSKASSAAASQAASSTAPVAAGSYGYGMGGGGDLSSYLAAMGATAPVSSAPTAAYSAPTGEKVVGSGFGGGTGVVTSPTGQTFDILTNWNQAQPILAQGGSLFYQPSPGIFQPATIPNASGQGPSALVPGLGPNTPLYVNQGASA
jgi:hypothetical protein